MRLYAKQDQFSAKQVDILNSKHEIPACGRQAKFETNSNDRNSKFKTGKPNGFEEFDHLNLGFVSDLDIRISDF